MLCRLLDRCVITAAIVAALVMTYTVIVFAQAASQPVVTEQGLLAWLATHQAWTSVIFVLVSFVATRALDLGLKEKIPKKWLPIVSGILGCAGQVSIALMAGSNWEQAIMFGIVSGLGGAGFYSAGGKALPKMRASAEK